MSQTTRRSSGAFTLIELMVVVALIGVLAAVAIPAYVRNARKAKTAEAVTNIRKVYISSRTYIFEDRTVRGDTATLPPQFPESVAVTPAASCCLNPGGKCVPSPSDWTSDTWNALHFSMADPHYYRYAYDSTGAAGAGVGSSFTVRALGDLNCDGVFSTFEMVGVWSSADRDVHGSGGIYANKELE